jgi:hypothetical protein
MTRQFDESATNRQRGMTVNATVSFAGKAASSLWPPCSRSTPAPYRASSFCAQALGVTHGSASVSTGSTPRSRRTAVPVELLDSNVVLDAGNGDSAVGRVPGPYRPLAADGRSELALGTGDNSFSPQPGR